VRRRMAPLSKPGLIEQLLELQNAYAVVGRRVAASECGEAHQKIAQKITNS
jgi:hypothetical protein